MSSETKEPSEVNEKKPRKKWSEKLNLKYKNDISKYVTIEPLLCIFLFRYLIFTLEQPYTLVKKCGELEGDVYVCEDVGNLSYFKAKSAKDWNYFKGNHTPRFVDRAWNDPEEDIVYEIFKKAEKSLDFEAEYSISIIFARMVQLLIILLISSFSDKFSKRKICLWIPLLGQFLHSIVGIVGTVFFNTISYEYTKLTIRAIEALTGGQELLLFGCFCYMSKAQMKKHIYIGLGLIGLFGMFVTLIRNTSVYKTFQESNITGAAYIYANLSYFIYIILCLLYVKVILNEIKRPEIEVDSEIPTQLTGDDDKTSEPAGSTTSKQKKISKRTILAKAFFLDVISDYTKLVWKDRKHKRRWIIILYLLITFTSSLWPYYKDCFTATFKVMETEIKIENNDFVAVILMAIPILVIYFKMSDLTVTIIATIGPHIASLVLKSFERTKLYSLDIVHEDDGIYDRFIGLLICAVLLLIVENTEFRIYLVFKIVSFGTAYLATRLKDYSIYKEVNKKSMDYAQNYIIQAYILLIVISLGFWLFVILMKKAEELSAQELETKSKSNPWKFVVAAQKLRGLASTSSSATRPEPTNGQHTDTSRSVNGENVETSNL